MTNFKSLLPPNSTQTERLLEQALVYDVGLYPQADKLRNLRTTRPDGMANWLAAEWGVAQFRPHYTSNTAFFAEVLPWLQMRGTARAVKQALGWINVDAKLEVEHFYLHVETAMPYYGALRDFINAVKQSQPAHLEFYRVFSGLDIRHGRYDESHYDNCYFDDDSGVEREGIRLSFAKIYSAQQPITIQADFAKLRRLGISTARLWSGSWNNCTWRHSGQLQITTETV